MLSRRAAIASTNSRRQVGNYQMGIGHERDDDSTYPGRIGGTYLGEGPQRGFYRRWLEFMDDD